MHGCEFHKGAATLNQIGMAALSTLRFLRSSARQLGTACIVGIVRCELEI